MEQTAEIMESFELTAYSVYARTDADNLVVQIFSDCFSQPQETDTLIKSGHGDEYVHVGYYQLYTSNGAHRYKISGGILTERSEEEIAEEIAGFPAPPETDAEKITRLEAELAAVRLALAEQYEENLALQEEVTNTQLALCELYENAEV